MRPHIDPTQYAKQRQEQIARAQRLRGEGRGGRCLADSADERGADSFRDAARAAARAERLGADVVARARLARSRDRRDEQLLARRTAARRRRGHGWCARAGASGAERAAAGLDRAPRPHEWQGVLSPRRLQDDDVGAARAARCRAVAARALERRDAARLQLVAIRAARRRSAGGRRVRETWRARLEWSRRRRCVRRL